jgi:hypothetical protein
MSEQQPARARGFDADEIARDRYGGIIGRIVKQMAQQFDIEPLSDDRRRLHRRLVARRQPIEPRQHHTLDRRWYRRVIGVAAQQLHEK